MAKVVRVWFGGDAWCICKDGETLPGGAPGSDPGKAVPGFTPLDLRVSSTPSNPVYLDEFFQYYVEKDEWARVATILSTVEGCGASSEAADICTRLMKGEEVWDGSTPLTINGEV